MIQFLVNQLIVDRAVFCRKRGFVSPNLRAQVVLIRGSWGEENLG